MITITLNELDQSYKDYLQKANSNINPYSKNQAWDIQAGAMAAFFLDLYYNTQLIENSIFPQNSIGDQVDKWLYSRGLPARMMQTYANIVVTLTFPTSGFPIVIPTDTNFPDPLSGLTFTSSSLPITVPNDTQTFMLFCTTFGINTIPQDRELSYIVDGTTIYTVKVVYSNAGGNLESDQSCITRILQSVRAPISGSRATDYQIYALESNKVLPSPVVTDALTIEGYQILGDDPYLVYVLGVVPLTGTAMTNYQLDLGLLPATTFEVYDRTIDATNIDYISTYIANLRLIGSNVTTVANFTYQLPEVITANVSLATGFTLATVITIESQSEDNTPISIDLTVEQLIQRELRRAICNQPFGATDLDDPSWAYITQDSIITSVTNSLNSVTGTLAKILTNFKIEYGGITQDIQVPLYNVNNSHYPLGLEYTYDVVDYANIAVVEV